MATDPYARSDTVFGAEAAARLAVMRATLAGSSFMDSMPLPPGVTFVTSRTWMV